jgi:hypothetical protein
MGAETRHLYLDLMKRTLTYSLWPEPPIPVMESDYARRAVPRVMVSVLSRLFRAIGIELCRGPSFTEQERSEGRIWPAYAHTMVGVRRLENLQQCIEAILDEGIEGDLIEAGVWRGGASIFMRAVLAAFQVADRRVFVADSFEGLPEPDEDKYPADEGANFHVHSVLSVSAEAVADNFRKYGLLDDQVVFLKGWFKDTLDSSSIGRLSLIRLDGDMYGSTMGALQALYPKLSPRGFCIIDDYALPACRAAVDDYRRSHGIRPEMREIDWTGRYWRKD